MSTTTSTTDLYAVLELKKNATHKAVKQAYRRLCKKYHPDTSKVDGAEHMFNMLQQAYEVLSDPVRREHYDRTGEILKATHSKNGEKDMSSVYQVVIRWFEMAISGADGEANDPGEGPVRPMKANANLGSEDYILKAMDIVRTKIKEMREEIVRGRAHLVKTAEKRRRIKFSGEGFDPLQDYYKKHEESVAQSIKDVEETIQVHEEALDFFANYSYEVDGKEPPRDSPIHRLVQGYLIGHNTSHT